MRTLNIAGSLLAVGILAGACGSGGNSASPTQQQSTPVMSSSGSSSAPGTAATSVDAKKADLGTILADDKGMTLYLFEKDKNNKSSCDGACAAAWPPLLTSGKATPGAGVNASFLGTTKRSDGTTQVTYHGWPLYYYAADKAPGDMTGQNVDAFGAEWYVLGSRTGEKLEKK